MPVKGERMSSEEAKNSGRKSRPVWVECPGCPPENSGRWAVYISSQGHTRFCVPHRREMQNPRNNVFAKQVDYQKYGGKSE